MTVQSGSKPSTFARLFRTDCLLSSFRTFNFEPDWKYRVLLIEWYIPRYWVYLTAIFRRTTYSRRYKMLDSWLGRDKNWKTRCKSIAWGWFENFWWYYLQGNSTRKRVFEWQYDMCRIWIRWLWRMPRWLWWSTHLCSRWRANPNGSDVMGLWMWGQGVTRGLGRGRPQKCPRLDLSNAQLGNLLIEGLLLIEGHFSSKDTTYRRALLIEMMSYL